MSPVPSDMDQIHFLFCAVLLMGFAPDRGWSFTPGRSLFTCTDVAQILLRVHVKRFVEFNELQAKSLYYLYLFLTMNSESLLDLWHALVPKEQC